MMDNFDDLLSASQRDLESNPFADPFAKRSSSPDPWSSPFARQEASSDVFDYQPRPATPPLEEEASPAVVSQHEEEDEPSATAVVAHDPLPEADPLGEARSPGFKESVPDHEPDPTFSEIATIRPTEPEESHFSSVPIRAVTPPPATPPPATRLADSVPTFRSPSPDRWGAPNRPLTRSYPGLTSGVEGADPGWGEQDGWSNGHSPASRLPTEDDSDDDKPVLQTLRGQQQREREDPSSSGAQPVFFITVDDPQKVGDPIRSFTMYTVHTRTTSPLFPKSAFSVLRRYSDFLWLYETLSNNNPGVVVPPVPEKNPFGRFEDHFVRQRRLALEKCITKIANHPVLGKDPDLKLFLESDTFTLDIKHRKAEIAQEKGGLMASIGQSLTGQRFFETDEWFDRQKAYLDSLESQLRGLVKAIEAVSKQRSELAGATGDFAQNVADLSASDVGQQLASSLAGLAEVERKAQDLQVIQSQQDIETFFSTVDEYARLINSVRHAFNTRIQSYHTWRAAEAELARTKQTHDKNRAQGRIPTDRVGYSLTQVTESERRALDAKHHFDQATKLVKAEVARFERERVEDFKNSLHAFLEGMISRQKELIMSWENYQQTLLKRVGGGRGLPPAGQRAVPAA